MGLLRQVSRHIGLHTKKVPDLIDFYITKGISSSHISCKSSADLSSDLSPVELLLSQKILQNEKPCRLHTRRTNWEYFRELIANSIDLKVSIQTDEDIINAVPHFNFVIQQAAWITTPPPPPPILIDLTVHFQFENYYQKSVKLERDGTLQHIRMIKQSTIN